MRGKLRFIRKSPGIILVIALLCLGSYLLGWSTLFSARSIAIEGTERTLEVQRTLAALPKNVYREKAPLARIDTRYISRKIASLDWVKSEKIMRDWLHGRIVISIREREPVAQFVNDRGGLSLIDKTGKVFDSPSSLSRYPVITFGDSQPILKSEIAAFIVALPDEFLTSLDSLAIRQPIYIQSAHHGLGNGRLIIRWGDNSALATKVKVINALLALEENKKARLIDVISPLNPIVK